MLIELSFIALTVKYQNSGFLPFFFFFPILLSAYLIFYIFLFRYVDEDWTVCVDTHMYVCYVE